MEMAVNERNLVTAWHLVKNLQVTVVQDEILAWDALFDALCIYNLN